ncbi:MAG: hypothetical protein GWM92_09930 [Gemmatimonadetes bacterium]|nr:hypothetical protein [Gemmatimonadota bacterium]NIR78981.1 hypothetical protein [Gemmatimonadota bacterium]NIT87630.1 hypothetical protein [Gemmatimonadota bacterium]NIU31492.1 hypothetical protein [Gemmatimonadota bacterium]NIU36159.1 hypothetical protein [Gemmatimonadota bacterium]
MLTREKLNELYRELREEMVLSIYLDGEGDDPADRKVWRRKLDHEIDAVRARMEGEPAEERDRFDEALSRLMERIDDFEAFVPGEGWVGFATPDQVWYTESVPVPMPTLVRWERGIRVAPYVRGLKQSRLVAAVLLDSRRARLFRYKDGELEEPEALRADTFLGDLTDMNISKRASTHSGTRGKTGTDAAQRFLEVGSERMLKQMVDQLSEIVGDDGLLVIGGTPEMVAKAAQSVPKRMSGRVAERPSMHVEMSAAEVRDAVEDAATELSRKLQGQLVGEVVDAALSNGRGCLGPEETERALRERRVDTLLLGRGFIEVRPDFADRCVGTAFEQHADVEEVSGDAEDVLAEKGGGIGARLRYRIRPGDEEEVEETEAA